MKNNLVKWLIFDILFIITLGTLGHFVYDWSGENSIVGLFFSVNESSWEHIKLAILPSLILFAIQYPVFHRNNNFYMSTFLSILLMIILIPALFYGYTAVIEDNLVFDIIDFVLSVVIGQIIFYKVMKSEQISKNYKILSIIGMVVIVICYLTFTYFPPRNLLFKDPITGDYGINGHAK
jgi:hypothetical protein